MNNVITMPLRQHAAEIVSDCAEVRRVIKIAIYAGAIRTGYPEYHEPTPAFCNTAQGFLYESERGVEYKDVVVAVEALAANAWMIDDGLIDQIVEKLCLGKAGAAA